MAQDINWLEKIEETSQFIKQRLNNRLPKTAIILGTGLGSVVDHIDIEVEIPYGEVPNFPVSTVEGHKAQGSSDLWHSRQQVHHGHAGSFPLL